MDSEAQGDTQSLVSITPSKMQASKVSKNAWRMSSGFFLSLLLHSFCFYGVYTITQKVFDIFAKREKVFRFTLIGGLPGEKRSTKLNARRGRALNNASNEKALKSKGLDLKANPLEAQSTGVVDLRVDYPRLSRLLGEEGEVIFVKESNEAGTRYRKLKSSGHRRLDEATEKVLALDSREFSEKLSQQEIEQLRFVFKLNERFYLYIRFR